MAVHDYKIRKYLGKQLPVQPDYWCRMHELTTPEDDFWIHYTSHELVGLTEREKKEHYYEEDPELSGIF